MCTKWRHTLVETLVEFVASPTDDQFTAKDQARSKNEICSQKSPSVVSRSFNLSV